MNYYELKITSGDNVIEIIDNKSNNLIDIVEIELDTVDNNTRTKSNAMLARVRVVGKVSKTISKQLQGIFEWSKDFSDNTYRKVDITIMDNSEAVLKSFGFDKMFVRDYSEKYGTSDGDQNGTFELLLSQSDRNFDSAEVFL